MLVSYLITVEMPDRDKSSEIRLWLMVSEGSAHIVAYTVMLGRTLLWG